MFSFFKRKRKSPDPGNKATAPDTAITYDAHLIGRLKEEHRNLLTRYVQIEKSARERQFGEARSELIRFKALFQQHILLENVKLYIYLAHCLERDGERLRQVSDMQRDMRHIGKTVNQFIGRYDAWPWTHEMETQFPGELERIGNALTARIKIEEEELYPLYHRPPGAA